MVVIKNVGVGSNGHTKWLCQCDCGSMVEARGDHLKIGYIKSCGCLVVENLRKMSAKHGLEHTRIYRIWTGMNNRCYNQGSNRYHRYGGRGIVICDEWKDDVVAFYDWAMANGYKDDLTIDRIDNDGPYSPENCRWATPKEQMNHTSRNKHITINGETKTVAQWAREYNIHPTVLNNRLKLGWDIETSLNKPVRKKRKQVHK